MRKKQENYLDYIPVISDKNTWSDDDGRVTIHMVHRGFYAKIAQKFFKKPRVSHIKLDKMGGFIFKNIDGEKTIEQIASLVKSKFKDEAEPLYNRLVKYMQILYNNGFITYLKGKD